MTTPLDDLRALRDRLIAEANEPRPLYGPSVVYVSAERFAWLVQKGYIDNDGNLTQEYAPFFGQVAVADATTPQEKP